MKLYSIILKNRKRLILLFLLILALPLTVSIAQKQQEIRQRAFGETINTLDYFVSKHQDKGLTGTHPMTQYNEGNKSYYVKWAPQYFEVLEWDNNYIYLREDQSQNTIGMSYTFSNGKWMKRFMQVGETIDNPSTANNIQWYDSNCNKIEGPSNNTKSGPYPFKVTLESHIPNYNLGGDLGIQDVIVLRYQPSPIWEKFYYSREWGWVKWEDANGNSAVFNKISGRILPNKSLSCLGTPQGSFSCTEKIDPNPAVPPSVSHNKILLKLYPSGDKSQFDAIVCVANGKNYVRDVNSDYCDILGLTPDTLYSVYGKYHRPDGSSWACTPAPISVRTLPLPTKTPTPKPTVTPTPSGLGSCRNNPVPPPPGYRWRAACKDPNNANDSCWVTDDTSNKNLFNSKCPKNTTQPEVNPDTSNWCYGFEGPFGDKRDWRCLQLRFITPTPTPTRVLTRTPTPTQKPTLTPTPTQPVFRIGDFDKDGDVDIIDFNIWRNEFLGLKTTKNSDANKDGVVDIIDFNLWRNNFLNNP